MTSLKQRTISIVLVTELLCAVAFSGVSLLHERRTRLRAFDIALQGRSDSVLGAIQDAEDPDDNVTIDPNELRLPHRDVFAVYNRGGRLLGTSKRAPAQLIDQQQSGFHDVIIAGTRYRVFQRDAMRIIDREENAGVGLQRPVTIIYASPLTHLWHGILGAVSFYILVSVALLALTAALLIVLLRRALEPLQELATEAARVSLSSLTFLPPESALRLSELEPLARALSDTIDRLKLAFEKEHRFVSDAAHELKTSVAVVRSTIQVMMLKPRLPEEYSTGLERLLQDNQRVEELIAQMLLLARLEEQPCSAPVRNDFAASAKRAIANLEIFAEEHAVEITTALSAEIYVRVSPEMIDILISNLVVNAVQASSRRSIVEITLSRLGEVAVFVCRDWGIGISSEAQAMIFNRFYREDTSRSRDTGGTGLGLPICKSIVESAHGSIEVDSMQGHGTTVTVRLPIA